MTSTERTRQWLRHRERFAISRAALIGLWVASVLLNIAIDRSPTRGIAAALILLAALLAYSATRAATERATDRKG